MAALFDGQTGFVAEGRAGQVQVQGAQRQVVEHVQRGDAGGAVLQRAQVLLQAADQVLVQCLFARQGAFARGQHLVLELLQLGGDEALRALQGLATHIVVGRIGGARLADLDVIAVHPVVADLEAVDAGALALAGLQVEQELVGVLRQGAQLVQFGIVAAGQHPAVAQHHRRVLHDGRDQQGMGRGMFTYLCRKRPQLRVVQRGEGRLQGR